MSNTAVHKSSSEISIAAERFLSIAEVMEFTSIKSRTTIGAMVREGILPPPAKLSAKRRGWRYSTLRRWADEREALLD